MKNVLQIFWSVYHINCKKVASVLYFNKLDNCFCIEFHQFANWNLYITEGKKRNAEMGSHSYTYIGCGCDCLNSISCLFHVSIFLNINLFKKNPIFVIFLENFIACTPQFSAISIIQTLLGEFVHSSVIKIW